MLKSTLMLFLVLTLITGAAYPLMVSGIARLTMPAKAGGSILTRQGKPIGSSLLGQAFADAGHFWGRPSATSPQPYNGAASTGSNLSPTNPALIDTINARVKALREADPGNTTPVPVDLVTASGSGLDPHISPAAALYQVPRVARARHLEQSVVRALVEAHIEARAFGLLGESRVNVLQLNLALDAGSG